MRLIARRLLQLVVVVVLATLFTFSLLRLLPGSAAEAAIPFGTPAQRAQFNEDNGLDKPASAMLDAVRSFRPNLVQA